MKGVVLTLFLGSTANEMTGSGTKIGSWNRIECTNRVMTHENELE